MGAMLNSPIVSSKDVHTFGVLGVIGVVPLY
jgi:hypothetical protein